MVELGMISQIAIYVGLIAVVVWTLRNPIVGVGAYWALAMARPQDVYWWSLGSSNLSLWVALVVCFMWLYGWVHRQHQGPGSTTINWLLLAFLALKTVSAVFAADQISAWIHMERVAKMILFYYVTVSFVSTRSQFRVMALVTAISIGYLGLWGNWRWYVEGFGGGLMGELAGPGAEVGSTYADRNLFGYLLVLGVPFCFFVFMTERAAWLRYAVLACLPFLANAVMLTFGRAAFMGLVAAGSCSVIRLRRLSVIVGVGLVGLLLLYRLAGPEVIARVMTVSNYEDDGSAMSRLESWKAGFQMILEHPLLGVGPENYGRYSAIYNPAVPKGLQAHNDFIQTAAESGLGAMVILVAILLLTFRNLAWVRRRTWGNADTRWAYYYAAMLESCLLSYIVGAMFVSLQYFEVFYLLIGMSVCLRRIAADPAMDPALAQPPAAATPAPWWRRVAAAKPV
jgi:probable O-glycosylation ligase (exosortase A-associated)